MKRFIIVSLSVLLFSVVLYAQEGSDPYDAFKGSFSMYDATAEMVVLKKIESQTDPETEKVMIGGLALTFEYFANAFEVVDGLQVASVYFTDKKDKYIMDYYVDGYNVVKIILVSKNGKVINKEVYPAKDQKKPGDQKKSGEKKSSK